MYRLNDIKWKDRKTTTWEIFLNTYCTVKTLDV